MHSVAPAGANVPTGHTVQSSGPKAAVPARHEHFESVGFMHRPPLRHCVFSKSSFGFNEAEMAATINLSNGLPTKSPETVPTSAVRWTLEAHASVVGAVTAFFYSSAEVDHNLQLA